MNTKSRNPFSDEHQVFVLSVGRARSARRCSARRLGKTPRRREAGNSQCDGLQGLPSSIWLHLQSLQRGSQEEPGEVHTKMGAAQHSTYTTYKYHLTPHTEPFTVIRGSTAQQHITHHTSQKTRQCKFPHQCVNPQNHENLKPPQRIQRQCFEVWGLGFQGFGARLKF